MNDEPEKIHVMLLFGGESSEHEISIRSVKSVYAAIDKSKYKVALVYIDKSGKWWLVDEIDQINTRSKKIFSELGNKKFVIQDTNEELNPDVILPILHGENCEDGCIQGLAKLMHIPIVGCGVASSAICMDKELTKKILEFEKIKIVPYVTYIKDDAMPDYNELSDIFGKTLFVKPAGCGSSIGVSKVESDEQLEPAILKAEKFDRKVLIEKAIIGRELEVAVIGKSNQPTASVVGEILPDSEFYDYNSKYQSNSQSKTIIPADISDIQSKQIQDIAKRAYELIGCDGFARIDFFLSNNGEIFLNEINSIPGFTDISMFPKLWLESGMAYSELIDKIIGLSLDKNHINKM